MKTRQKDVWIWFKHVLYLLYTGYTTNLHTKNKPTSVCVFLGGTFILISNSLSEFGGQLLGLGLLKLADASRGLGAHDATSPVTTDLEEKQSWVHASSQVGTSVSAWLYTTGNHLPEGSSGMVTGKLTCIITMRRQHSAWTIPKCAAFPLFVAQTIHRLVPDY